MDIQTPMPANVNEDVTGPEQRTGGFTLHEMAHSAESLRILIADDNRDSAECLAMALRLDGNQVWTAGDGVAAVQAAVEYEPHAIVMDIGMPGMNGYEAASQIRQLNWRQRPVLIALTGWEGDDDRRQSKDAGFDHHLVKPVNTVALANLLASLSADQPDP